MTVLAKTHLSYIALTSNLRNIILKIQYKKPALPWYWTCSLSIMKLSYLLAFVQLTWEGNNDWFSPAFDDFLWNSLILGQRI